MRKAGLSAAKAKTLKELSRTITKGELDLPALRRVPEEEAVAKLSSVWGIGRWTAEMFLIFALERPGRLLRGRPRPRTLHGDALRHPEGF